MTDDKIKLMFEKCTLDKANDKKLPSDSFIVSYEEDKELKPVSYTHLTLPTNREV